MQVLDKILDASTKRFMQVGIRSVSMDDIASELGMSKKTIYQHFENKQTLVEKAIERHLKLDEALITELFEQATDAIDEMAKLSRYSVMMFRSVKPTLLYDLQKYYRSVWENVNDFHDSFVRNSITDNIVRGQREGLYRAGINPEIVAKLYVKKSLALVDESTFSLIEYQREALMKEHLMYHLHGILSDNGREHLKTIKIFE